MRRQVQNWTGEIPPECSFFPRCGNLCNFSAAMYTHSLFLTPGQTFVPLPMGCVCIQSCRMPIFICICIWCISIFSSRAQELAQKFKATCTGSRAYYGQSFPGKYAGRRPLFRARFIRNSFICKFGSARLLLFRAPEVNK